MLAEDEASVLFAALENGYIRTAKRGVVRDLTSWYLSQPRSLPKKGSSSVLLSWISNMELPDDLNEAPTFIEELELELLWIEQNLPKKIDSPLPGVASAG